MLEYDGVVEHKDAVLHAVGSLAFDGLKVLLGTSIKFTDTLALEAPAA